MHQDSSRSGSQLTQAEIPRSAVPALPLSCRTFRDQRGSPRTDRGVGSLYDGRTGTPRLVSLVGVVSSGYSNWAYSVNRPAQCDSIDTTA